jgi:hypothetical protein
LSVKASLLYLGGDDTTFVTKRGFIPTGEMHILLSHTEAPNDPRLFPLLRSAGAIQAGTMIVRLVFTGESARGVRILNITPVVIDRAAPWHGDLFIAAGQGQPQVIQTTLNLDSPIPVVRAGNTDRPYFEQHTITLHANEQEVVDIAVKSSRAFFAYNLKIDYLAGTKARQLLVTDGGRPFKISAFHCVTKAVMAYDYAMTLNGLFQYIPIKYPSKVPGPCST